MEALKETIPFVLDLQDSDKATAALVGGKGANLTRLSKIPSIQAPSGFCVTTEAFRLILEANPSVHKWLLELSLLKPEQQQGIKAISAAIRAAIETTAIPDAILAGIRQRLSGYEADTAFAIRSSATAEDLPDASFAGLQDTYLNITGEHDILQHIRKCWASLFTDRAVIYRMRQGFDNGSIALAVIVQQMVFPQTAGVMFTADPVTGNRKVTSIDASFGLGEALVAGLVNADNYKVSHGNITEKKISRKKVQVHAAADGGTHIQELPPEMQHRQALTDEHILKLEQAGRILEAHFGYPQDIEWCMAGDQCYILQSRPVTTLYPVPETGHQGNRIYISVGHQQMMTDAMKPLGLSVRQLTAGRAMYSAGGRLFVDVTDDLTSPARKGIIVNVLGKSDPLISDAVKAILERKGFLPVPDDDRPEPAKAHQGPDAAAYQQLKDYDPPTVAALIRQSEAAIAVLKKDISTRSGAALLDFIEEDITQLRQYLSAPESFSIIMTAMNAAFWLNEKMEAWLGEKNMADILSQSVAGNVTSAMGLALLDVADAIRPYPAVIRYLEQTKDEAFLETLDKQEGGAAARQAILSFLDSYGMRCAGEIDITKPRWAEKPLTLVPVLLSNIRNFERGESKRRFKRGLREALGKKEELLQRLAALPDGAAKVQETARMTDLLRNGSGYREYPKYHMVCRYFIYKQAMLREAAQLAQAHIIKDPEDIYYLSFEELREVINTRKCDPDRIAQRKRDHRRYEKLEPPRVITSDGEIITGNYKRNGLPDAAIIGLAVSSGIVEGRARIILDIEKAVLEKDDILVTTFTDPSWTPLFVSIKGLVTEVGGLMTHGAVIAREYGLPAVVGVDNATRLIRDGQRIRVNGTDGYIELL